MTLTVGKVDYLSRIVALADGLGGRARFDSAERREFLRGVVRVAECLQPALEENPSSIEAELADALSKLDERRILRVAAGAQSRRRRDLAGPLRRMVDAFGVASETFGILGETRSELAHTAMLRAFLDVRGPFPELALDANEALARLLAENGAEPSTRLLPQLDSRTEHVLASGNRVDLVLESKTHLVYVEVKVDASERHQQLDDYSGSLGEDAKVRAKTGLLVFLTRDPKQLSATNEKHVHITFKDMLRVWLPLASSSAIGADELARYLKIIAWHLYELAARGAFEDWPLHVQRRCLEFVEKEGNQ